MTLRLPKSLLFLVLLAIVLLIIIFIAFLNLTPNQQTSTGDLPLPTSAPIVPNTSSIQQREVTPKEDLSGQTVKNPSQQITFTMNEPVTPDDVTVTVDPPLPIKVQRGPIPGTLSVFPDPPEFWRFDTLYTVIIRDSQGRAITSYQIKVPPLDLPDPD